MLREQWRRVATYLLEKHDEDSDSSSAEVGRVGEERLVLSETELDLAASRVVLKFGVVMGRDAVLEEFLCLDFKELHLYEQIGLGKASKRLLFSALVDEPSRRFGEEEDTNGEDDSRKDLDSDRDQPSCSALSHTCSSDKVRTVSEPVRDHDTERDSQLRNPIRNHNANVTHHDVECKNEKYADTGAR